MNYEITVFKLFAYQTDNVDLILNVWIIAYSLRKYYACSLMSLDIQHKLTLIIQ